MNLAWLSYYTNSDNVDALRINNEKNAFATYARWRAVIRWISRLYTFLHLYFQKRAANRKLMSLPDYLLTDIGMYRSGDEIKVEMVRPVNSETTAVVMSDDNEGRVCVVLPVTPASKNQSSCISADNDSRAA